MDNLTNPTAWFYAESEDAEWWYRGAATRAETIAAAQTKLDPEQPFFIAEAKRLVPSLAIFDGADLAGRIGEDECWGEDGWEGDPVSYADLEAQLTATLERWFVGLDAPLTGAQLDFISAPEKVEAARG